jgi:hypothetical protein
MISTIGNEIEISYNTKYQQNEDLFPQKFKQTWEKSQEIKTRDDKWNIKTDNLDM